MAFPCASPFAQIVGFSIGRGIIFLVLFLSRLPSLVNRPAGVALHDSLLFEEQGQQIWPTLE